MRLQVMFLAVPLIVSGCSSGESARRMDAKAKATAELATQQAELGAAIAKLGETPNPSAVSSACDSAVSFKVITESSSLRSTCGAAYMEAAREAIRRKDRAGTKRYLESARKSGVGWKERLVLEDQEVTLYPKYTIVGSQGMMNMVSVPPSSAMDREGLEFVVRRICGSQSHCEVMFWLSTKKAPRKLPMSDSQVFSMHAMYNINTVTGLDEWTCHPFGSSRELCSNN